MTEEQLLAVMAALIAGGMAPDDLGNVFLTRPTSDAVYFVECARDILSAVRTPAALQRAEGAA